jgi:fibronectin-binding autotransporter adhesin
MKPSSFSALLRGAYASGVVAISSSVASAIPYWWDGGAGDNDWGNALNWSLTSAADPVATDVPGSADLANITATDLTGPFTINLNGDRSILGLDTENLITLATLEGGSATSTLTIGGSGINHNSGGGLTIGSATPGKEVNISIAANQNWISSAAGTGQAAILINNAVSNGSGSAATLTLSGINNNATINGVISNGTATLNILKSGSGTWTLNNNNTYSGTTSVSQGTLRLITAGAVATPSNITVASGATLSLRVAGSGFAAVDVDTYRSAVTFSAVGSFLGIDTANGNFTYSSNINGAHSLNKLGGNTLTLDGTNTYTGTTTITEGALAYANIGAYNGKAISVTANGILIGLAGGANLTAAQLDTLRTAGTYAAGGVFGISTNNEDFVYSSVMTGGLRFQKSGNNTLFLTGNSTYAGGTNVSGGILSIDNIANGGSASALGSSTNVAANLNLAGGRLRYTGDGDTTNRLFQLAASSSIDSSGYGALVFSNTGTNTAVVGNASARTLTLTGYNKDANTIAGIINNSGTGVNVTNITKLGSGNWTLSGANTFTGVVRISGGRLTADYSTSDPLAASATVLSNNGTLELKGKSTGTTSETFASLTLGENNNGLGHVWLNGNGGSGFNLTVTSLAGTTNSQRHDLIDLSGNSGNSVTVTALASTMGVANNVLMNVTGTRASTIFRATDGTYGFASFSGGGTSGTLQKLSSSFQTTLAAGSVNMNSNTTNYLINAPGTYTQSGTAGAIFSTVTLDSTAGAIDWALGSNVLNASGNGKAMLFSGSNNITISGGTGATAGSSLWFHNYLDAGSSLNVSASFGTGNFLLFGGSGTTIYSGTGLGANLLIDGGIFRVTAAQTTATNIRLGAGGVFEIGADLNGAGAGDFTHGIGTAANQILFNGDSGLSAFGANRLVNFGGAGAAVTWGAGNFLTLGDSVDGDYSFKLSSNLSNAMIEVQNSINLNGKTRVVDVADGIPADIDARLSGALTGGLSAGLIKAGAGTLSLTGTNTYQGATRIDQGKLIVGGGGINATTSVHVRNSSIEIAASGMINDNARIILENGAIITQGGISETMGTLAIIGDNQLNLNDVGNAIRFADSSAQVWNSTLAILDWAGLSTGGGDDQVYFGSNASGLTGSQLSKITFVNPTVDGQFYSGNFGASILATGEIVAVIPEPSLAALAFVGAGAVILRRRRAA